MSPLMSSDSLDLSNVQTEHKEGKTDIFLHVYVLPSSLDHLPGGTNHFFFIFLFLFGDEKGLLYLHDNSKRMLS